MQVLVAVDLDHISSVESRVDVLLRISQLYLEDNDAVSASRYVTRAHRLITQCNHNIGLVIRHRVCNHQSILFCFEPIFRVFMRKYLIMNGNLWMLLFVICHWLRWTLHNLSTMKIRYRGGFFRIYSLITMLDSCSTTCSNLCNFGSSRLESIKQKMFR
jgi:hypothetical protein